MKKVVLITGASSGIGKETAKLFAQNGFQVIAVARNLEKMKDPRLLDCSVFSMDVTNEESIQNAFKQIYSKFNQIDILINNAGYSQNGFIEELTLSQLKYQFDVNVFGLVRVTQMVLPKMREANSGHIINVGSVGGDFTTAGAGAYHASKYAVESFSDAMRQELSGFGIKVSLIKPGGVETAFVDNSAYPNAIAGNPYARMRANFQDMMQNILKAKNSSFPILKPIEVGNVILDAAKSNNPKTRIRVGRTAKTMPLIKRFMSDKAFDKMIMNQLGLLK
ncbi:SDR family NAD(P)-dependent oxidoreductase [Flavobacterium sp.]|uniref:SDR family NAD(P)-dependent oxidoreductase n=1 Tax=Flavobacterium sp. TaxID=239 RepID=UPI00261F5C3E|nr:SDR family NAD(P)-dependent oxidoreductase [Flavobacterium sp.]